MNLFRRDWTGISVPSRPSGDQRLRLVVVGAMVCLLAGAAGCRPATGNSAENEEDHLEHHIPPHRPANFADAVTQLRIRFEPWIATSTNPSATTPEQVQELRDIIGWLPEIAGETDLPKREWDVVFSLSQELTDHFARLQGSGGSVPNGAAGQESPRATAIATILDRLSYLVPEKSPQESSR